MTSTDNFPTLVLRRNILFQLTSHQILFQSLCIEYILFQQQPKHQNIPTSSNIAVEDVKIIYILSGWNIHALPEE